MSQQYVLLRKENDLLNSLIGQSFNQKSKFEDYKILKQIHKQADQYSMEKALCYIVDKGEIKGVGGSSLMKNKKTGEIISDLILDQFGQWFAAILRKNDPGATSTGMVTNAGIGGTVNIYGTSVIFNQSTGINLGAALKVGSGTTVPARTDFKIETAFATLPESLNFKLGSSPVYNSSLGNFKPAGLITAGGSGTVNESILEGIWRNVVTTQVYTLFRDIISPGQSFIAGQQIALEYTVQL